MVSQKCKPAKTKYNRKFIILRKMQEKVLMFRSITEDHSIAEKEIVKFINWGKGDVQQALNYYFRNLEKGKIAKPGPAQQPKKQTVRQQPQKIPATKKIEEEEVRNVQVQEQRASEMSINSQQQSFGNNSMDAFQVLRQGSIQHKKTHDFIKHVREVYKLPIRGKAQQDLIKSSKSCLPEHEGKMPQQFLMVDCLTQAFNPELIEEIMDKKDPKDNITKRVSEKSKLMPLQKEKQESKSRKIQLQISQSGDSKVSGGQEQSFKDLDEYEYKHVYSNSRPQINQQKQKPKPSKQPKKNLKASKIMKQKPIDQLIPIKVKSKPEIKNSAAILEQDEMYLGDYFVKGFCTEKRKFDTSCIGSKVDIQSYIQEAKTKKKNWGKSVVRNMNMRISWQGRQVGRINDDEVRILMPLIDQALIRVEFFIQDVPIMADVFKPVTLKVKVYALRNLITEPIVENYQPQQGDKERVHQLSGLLQKLSLPIKTQPLIKGKSKYIRQQKPKAGKKKYQSIDQVHFQESQKQEELLKKFEEKNQQQMIRMRTDPNFSQKQQSLKDMISKNQKNLKQREIIIEERDEQPDGLHVKKKVIQIDKQQQRDKLSELIELHEENCEPFYPKSNFKSELYPYQALALAWMLRRQGYLAQEEDKEELHPLWTEYQTKTSQKYRHLYFNELTGQLCVKRPTTIVKCKGGILADEMGLGKTVMMAALIVSNPPPPPAQSQDGQDHACTLVIVPLTLLSQWESEISKHTVNQKVITYYSSDRKKIVNSLGKYSVVLSTYGTVSHQYAQGLHTKKAGIYKYKWHRVILDQAHYIKGRIIQTSKAVYELASTYRWCLTGTPIQNTATDIFSLLHFIKYTPWSEFACWNRFIVKPLQEEDQSIFNVLRAILKKIFLRRTKASKGADGKPIIELPPRISKVQLLTMSEKEREFYDSIYAASRSDFDALIEKGILEAKYMQVLEILMRLRQICCHPILFKSVTKFSKTTEEFESQLRKLIQKAKKKQKASDSQSDDEYYQPIIDQDNQEFQVKTKVSAITQDYFKQVMQKVVNENLDKCIICFEQPQDPVINCCLHIFCKACNIRQIQEKGTCSFCRAPLTKDDFIHLPRENRLNIKKDRPKEQNFLSTKMIALNEHILKLKPDDKVVIFSQFLGMLDLLEEQLKKNRLRYVRMEGSNTHKQRTRIVTSFQEDPQIQIFLVSLKTAGVGLNLVAANKVFLMDPWWNPAVEEQAIERVHRIGQKRQVQIVRFITDKTIETRMLQLNTEKKALSQNILNQNQDGNTAKQKIEKLKYLMENY